ncbi:hypothetical protein CWI85_29810 [Streptomyces albidoflavus]|nr:hypothetical protein CWI85_29810 [Streptomyces albidoflavus]
MSDFSASISRQRWHEEAVIVHQPYRAIRSHQQISMLKISVGYVNPIQIVYGLGKVASHLGNGFLVLIVSI